jgi:hypothetical protein
MNTGPGAVSLLEKEKDRCLKYLREALEHQHRETVRGYRQSLEHLYREFASELDGQTLAMYLTSSLIRLRHTYSRSLRLVATDSREGVIENGKMRLKTV